MLLPTKGISQERALITISADALSLLDTPSSVSGLWEKYQRTRSARPKTERVTFDWFSLGLAAAFALGAIEFNSQGLLQRADHVHA